MSTRLHNLDVIRGIAILGIPLMNIYIFALPEAAYLNPDWQHQATLTDKLVFSFHHLFFDGRFMALFCLLFGAGMVLMWERLRARGVQPVSLMQRRLGWLLLFGAIHGTFVWFGDILFIYGLAGLFLLQTGLPTLPSRQLFTRGMLFFIAGQLFLLAVWLAYPSLPNDITAELASGFTASDSELDKDIALWTGPWLPQLAAQFQRHILEGAFYSMISYFWSISGLMLIGAGLYKSGVFGHGLPLLWQWTLCAVGLTMSGLNLATIWQDNFDNPRAMYSVWNQVAALPMALFYLSAITKLANASRLSIFRSVGRMAFTLYIIQSIVLVLVFRWCWPDLYGHLDRITLFGIALALGLIQLVLANIWLQRFRQGPLEKLWRYLIYSSLPNTGEGSEHERQHLRE